MPVSLDPEGVQPDLKRRKVEEGSLFEWLPGGEDVNRHLAPECQLDEGPSNVEKSELELKGEDVEQEIRPQSQPGLPGKTREEGAGYAGRSGVNRHHLEEGRWGESNRDANEGVEEEGGAQGCDERMMHVLAVDDSPVDRKLVERLLKDVPYKVTTAESGVHALGVLGLDQSKAEDSEAGGGLQKVPPNFDLIMTDYSMPGLTGYQLLQRLKKEETGLERVPVVIMSSDNFPKRVAKCIEGGAEEYLQKPVQAADIHRINAQILKRKGSEEVRSPSPGHDESAGVSSPPGRLHSPACKRSNSPE
ncbi:type-A response regulator [Klebsormidium nitens]|uniref:Type-A response regulator n=1 Tax=Klebsormidium nitens TaxID=105231 RepID=A0A1Y1HVA8_KLENI|nr:type-A response regulator [Klebsormidium nitens]|eukprot:GAQ80911.1 type-A response regulator [Klebsormidium nitens]